MNTHERIDKLALAAHAEIRALARNARREIDRILMPAYFAIRPKRFPAINLTAINECTEAFRSLGRAIEAFKSAAPPR